MTEYVVVLPGIEAEREVVEFELEGFVWEYGLKVRRMLDTLEIVEFKDAIDLVSTADGEYAWLMVVAAVAEIDSVWCKVEVWFEAVALSEAKPLQVAAGLPPVTLEFAHDANVKVSLDDGTSSEMGAAVETASAVGMDEAPSVNV